MDNEGSTHLNLGRAYGSGADTEGMVHKIISGWREIREGGQLIGVACKRQTEVGKVKYKQRTRRSLG